MSRRRILFLSAAGLLALAMGVALFRPRVRNMEPQRPEFGRRLRRAAPVPMFSKEYVEALSDILELEDSDEANLRDHVERTPDNLTARLRLLAYYKRADQVGRAENVVRRWERWRS